MDEGYFWSEYHRVLWVLCSTDAGCYKCMAYRS